MHRRELLRWLPFFVGASFKAPFFCWYHPEADLIVVSEAYIRPVVSCAGVVFPGCMLALTVNLHNFVSRVVAGSIRPATEDMSTLERAIEIATEAHRGQRDKAGRDYIGHPLRVMAAGRSSAEKIVGVLHDVVEDSGWTFEGLAAEGFAPDIIAALRCLTHDPREPYDRYIARVKGNPLAVAVKLNDLADNMDIRRLPYISDKDVRRLKRYLRAYKQLTGEPTYSVYACRAEYPNAYMPWSEEDDLELTRLWCEGVTVKELSAHFMRKPGAIRSRIEKLDLERLYGEPNKQP